MQRILFALTGLLLIAGMVSGCADTVTTPATVRQAALRDGCWPYGGYQAPTPTAVTPNPTDFTLGTPAPPLLPRVVAFPTCLPGGQTPTVTTTPIPRSTPQSNDFQRGLAEVGGTNGKNTNHALAITPDGTTVVVGWINWRQDPTKTEDGLVWVNARAKSGVWGTAQTLNTSATTINGIVSGLALAAPTNTQIVAAWGDGRSAILSAESSDGGQTWGAPSALGNFAYQVISLKADQAGGLHLLALTDGFHELRYRYRAAGSSTWTAPSAVGRGPQYQSAFAVLDLPNGGVRRFAVWSTSPGPHMRLARSDDGQTWTSIAVETDRYRAEIAPVAPTLVAAVRPDGSGVVTLAWCQYSKSGVYAQVSTDSGITWGGEEAVFQNLIDGYAPSLSYDRASDAVVLAVTELLRHHVPPRRVRLAARPLHPQAIWRFRAVSDTLAPDDDGEPGDDGGASLDPTLPTRAPDPTAAPTFTPDPDAPMPTNVSAVSAAQSDQADVPILARWGWRGTIFGNPAGSATWLMTQDERNVQDRLYAQPLNIPALLAKEVS